MSHFLQNLTGHLNLIPAIVGAVQAFQAIGHTKESALAKIVQIVEVSAALGEQVPIVQVQLISTSIENIVEQIFGSPKPVPAPVS